MNLDAAQTYHSRRSPSPPSASLEMRRHRRFPERCYERCHRTVPRTVPPNGANGATDHNVTTGGSVPRSVPRTSRSVPRTHFHTCWLGRRSANGATDHNVTTGGSVPLPIGIGATYTLPHLLARSSVDLVLGRWVSEPRISLRHQLVRAARALKSHVSVNSPR